MNKARRRVVTIFVFIVFELVGFDGAKIGAGPGVVQRKGDECAYRQDEGAGGMDEVLTGKFVDPSKSILNLRNSAIKTGRKGASLHPSIRCIMSKEHICPVELAGSLDNRLRRWLQPPGKYLATLVREGMTCLDIGCGVGYFTLEMAKLAGSRGKVIATDLQPGMLEILSKRIIGTDLEPRITRHVCDKQRLGIMEQVDFALAFYMIHEVPDRDRLIKEVFALVRPGGTFLVVEPRFHVSSKHYNETLRLLQEVGFKEVRRREGIIDMLVELRRP